MVVPYCEFPLALIHFTGSGHMNRSMRSKADKMVSQPFNISIKTTVPLTIDSGHGLILSEHKLCTGVIRKVSLVFSNK